MQKRTQPIQRKPGFTLIEILVVLLIVGIVLASIVAKALPSEHQVLQQEATRLALLLEQARDEAFTSGRSIAWSAQTRGYTFWQLNADREWRPFANDQALRARTLPSSMGVTSLRINQVQVPVGEGLVFSPAGLNPSFDTVLSLQAQRMRLSSNSQGRIQIHDEP